MEGGDERLNGGGADADERRGGSFPHVPVLVFEGGDEGLDGTRTDVDKRLAGSYPYEHALVSECGYQGLHGPGGLDAAQRHRGVPANALLSVFQGGDEGLHGRGADVAERLGRSFAYIPVFQGGHEGLHGRGADVAEGLGGSFPHVALLVAQCLDQLLRVAPGFEPLDVGQSEHRHRRILLGISLTRTGRLWKRNLSLRSSAAVRGERGESK